MKGKKEKKKRKESSQKKYHRCISIYICFNVGLLVLSFDSVMIKVQVQPRPKMMT